jgi:hypothetical protein
MIQWANWGQAGVERLAMVPNNKLKPWQDTLQLMLGCMHLP